MAPLKLIISGPVGAGKTTFIQSLSDIPVVETDEVASEDIGKAQTTIAMDFGSLTLDGLVLHLFGTPGQERFDFMWDMLAEGALGLVLLVSGTQPRDFPNARRILDYITTRHAIPFVVAVTRQDMARAWTPCDIADYFSLPRPYVRGLDATDRSSALETLRQLMEVMLSDIRQS